MTITGNTAAQLTYPQSRRGDFLWVLYFYDVAENGTRTAKDLTGYEFFFKVLGPDGTTWIEGTTGDGITVASGVVTIAYERTVYDTVNKVLLKGCQYDMQLDLETPTGFYKPLVEAKLSMT